MPTVNRNQAVSSTVDPNDWEDYTPDDTQTVGGNEDPNDPSTWADAEEAAAPEEESWGDYLYRHAEDAVEKTLPTYAMARNAVGAVTGSPRDLDEAGADAIIGAVYEGPRRMVSALDAAIEPIVPDFLAADQTRDDFLATQGEDEGVGVEFTGMSGEGSMALETGATLGPTILGGMGGGALLGKALSMIPKAAAWIGATVGSSVGYAATKKPGEDRMVVGENAVWPIFDGLDEKDEEGRKNALNIFVNDTVDAMAIAFPGEAAAAGASKLASIAYNTLLKPAWKILRGQPGAAIEDQVARQFVYGTRAVRDAKTPAEAQEAKLQLAEFMKEHAEVLFKEGPEDIKILQDTVSAMEQGMEGIEGDAAEIVRQKARSLRAGALEMEPGGSTAAKVSAPSNLTDETLQVADANYGGTPGIDEAQVGVQKQAADRAFDEGTAPIVAKDTELEAAQTRLSSEFADDPALAKQINKLSETVDLNVFRESNITRDKIRGGVEQAYQQMDQQMTDLVDQIPEGEMVDLSDVIDDLIQINPKYLKQHEKYGMHMPDPEGDEITGDFKKMWKKLVPELNIEISSLLAAGKDASALRSVRDAIATKADSVPGAKAFREYYKNTWAPLWKDGKLDEFRKLYKKTIGRGEKVGKTNYEAGSNKILKTAMSDDPAYTEQLDTLLKMPESGVKDDLITDWYLQNTAAKIQKGMNSGTKLDKQKIEDLIGPLSEHAANLERTNPAAAERLNVFATKIRDQKLSIEDIQKELVVLQKNKDKIDKQIFETDYAEFYEGNKAKIGSGYGSFDELLKNPKNSNKVKQIVGLADEKTRQGMKAAYVRHLKESIFSPSAKMPGGARKVNVAGINDYMSGKSALRGYGKEIFGDEPKTLEFFESLMNHANKMEDSLAGVKSVPQQDHIQDMINKASSAVDRLITLTLGVLNRYAARARSIKGMALQDYDVNLREGDLGNLLHIIVDNFYANPKYAAKLIERISKGSTSKLSPEFKKNFRQWMLHQIPGGNPEDIDNSIAETWENADDTNAQTEDVLKGK